MKVLMSQDELDSLFLISGKISGNPIQSFRYIFSKGLYDFNTKKHIKSLNFIKNDTSFMTYKIYNKSEHDFRYFCSGNVEFYDKRWIDYENV